MNSFPFPANAICGDPAVISALSALSVPQVVQFTNSLDIPSFGWEQLCVPLPPLLSIASAPSPCGPMAIEKGLFRSVPRSEAMFAGRDQVAPLSGELTTQTVWS